MTDQEWLQGLKVGDEVAVEGRGGATLAKVERVTATQLAVDGTKFRRSSGCQVTSNIWHRLYLSQPSDEIRAKIELAKLRRKAQLLRDRLPVPSTKEELLAFIAALEPFVKKEGKP